MSELTANESRRNFKVLGVDLAAQPSTTALCEITITHGVPDVTMTRQVCDDEFLLKRFCCPNVARIGIDSPFGWPQGLVDALSAWRSLKRWRRNTDSRKYPPLKSTPREPEQYRDLKYRETDVFVWEQVGLKPISVAVNALGSVAIRNASLLSRAGAKDKDLSVDRSGRTGRFVEVYPAAALHQWCIDPKGKSSDSKKWCKRVMGELLPKMTGKCCREVQECPASKEGTPTIALAQWGDLKFSDVSEFRKSDHVVDAFVSAIVALMAELDRRIAPKREDSNRLTHPIPRGKGALAKREGWIVLPKKDSLKRLASQLDNLLSEPVHGS